MNKKIEKELRGLLPYLIITGILFLLLPLFMGSGESAATYIIQIGFFPLTAIGCGTVYKLQKHRNSFYLCLIAPIFYALTALIYGMWRSSWYTVLIYLAAYFLCGYLGLMLGDILPVKKSGGQQREQQKRSRPADDRRPSADRKPAARPRRVNLDDDPLPVQDLGTEDPDDDRSLDTSTTSDDIEAILNNIHNRKS